MQPRDTSLPKDRRGVATDELWLVGDKHVMNIQLVLRLASWNGALVDSDLAVVLEEGSTRKGCNLRSDSQLVTRREHEEGRQLEKHTRGLQLVTRGEHGGGNLINTHVIQGLPKQGRHQ